MNLYKKELLDHFKNPRNYGTLQTLNISSGEYNPSCGDMIEIHGLINNNILEKVAFTGKGCVISQSATSMLTEFCINKTTNEILSINPESITQIIGVSFGPNRMKCVLLGLFALQKAIKAKKC